MTVAAQSPTTTIPASPARLRSGDWGARIGAPHHTTIAKGDLVTITTRGGKTWDARVTDIVTVGADYALVGTESVAPPPHKPTRPAVRARSSSSPRGWRSCGYPGCNPRHCDECGGEGA